MDFGAEIADRSYQEIPTGALRPRNDILGSAVRLNGKLKFNNHHHRIPVQNCIEKGRCGCSALGF